MPGDEFATTLAAAQSGDEAAFGQLWRATNPLLLRYLRVRAPGLAEDLAAETWLGAMAGLGSFSGDESAFRGWLVTIARNKLADHERRRARRPEALVEHAGELAAGTTPDTADVVAEQDATTRALRLIAELPPDVAEMVTLRVVVGLDVADVAQVVGRKPGAVRVAVHRGLRRLATTLHERGVTLQDPPTIQE